MSKDSLDRIREAAESDLSVFIKLVSPHRVLGQVHEDLIQWWTRPGAKEHQLCLMPRDHQKSALIAYRVAWTITKDPTSTFLYISSASTLAVKQLYFIKSILDSKIYRRYWPEMTHEDEGKRIKWAMDSIIVDHPQRKEEGIRDDTIRTAGLTTSITGLHFTHAVLDDVVVKENADTKEGRDKVKSQYSLLSSIESTGTDKNSKSAYEWIVGTRYHPDDLYGQLMAMESDVFDKNYNVIDKEPVYEIFQQVVEDSLEKDGTGDFLWPRQQNKDGRWYGFSPEILAKKRAKYLDKTQFYAQYYNDPNGADSLAIDRSRFQYFEKRHLHEEDGYWLFKDEKLNLFAAIDFAFSLKLKADSTSIVVIGVDSKNNIYVLDIERFKTDKISEYFNKMLELHYKWGVRKWRAEVTVAQQAIVREIKEQYIKPRGLNISIDEYRPSRHEGDKAERISAILEHRYENMQIWHGKSGNIQLLEEELILQKPPHDDIKDALANAVAISVPAKKIYQGSINNNVVQFHSRFGGLR